MPRQEPDGEDEEPVAKAAAKGFRLPFDVVRRFSQPMGIDLERWTGRIIAQEKGAVRLLPVAARAKSLFGIEGSAIANGWIDSGQDTGTQQSLFPNLDTSPMAARGRRQGSNGQGAEPILQSPDATALDRVHAAMLLAVPR